MVVDGPLAIALLILLVCVLVLAYLLRAPRRRPFVRSYPHQAPLKESADCAAGRAVRVVRTSTGIQDVEIVYDGTRWLMNGMDITAVNFELRYGLPEGMVFVELAASGCGYTIPRDDALWVGLDQAPRWNVSPYDRFVDRETALEAWARFDAAERAARPSLRARLWRGWCRWRAPVVLVDADRLIE